MPHDKWPTPQQEAFRKHIYRYLSIACDAGQGEHVHQRASSHYESP